ncbi:MAG: transposase [Akkermansiaceae bacterium]|nr:transposase [Armatimonadota bacterium]
MPVRRNPGIEILLHFRWKVAVGKLTPASIAKLGPYITRYAETLNVRVHAVGGVADHLHLLADLPPDMPADRLSRELHAPTARYLRDVQSVKDFGWNSDSVDIRSVSPTERETVAVYLAEQEARHADGDLNFLLEQNDDGPPDKAAVSDEELPDWLTSALQ